MRLLVADDNDINLKVASAFLKALGVSRDYILTAKNGEEAIEQCLNNKIDLVFMDIQMPVIDGVEATKKILQEAEEPPCIVALTANVSEGVEARYLKQGMKMVIAKPVTKDAFREALRLINFEAIQ